MIDDDIDFLGNLSLQLDADLAYLLFDSTRKALDYLEQRQSNGVARNRFFCEPPGCEGAGAAKSLEINMDALSREIHSSDRFAQISVALVDYAMPQMNGLDFCKNITDPHVKKVLFTGVATEAVAVEAFNEGIIDQYIRKHEHAVYERLNKTIRQFQHDYIRNLFVSAKDVLPLNVPELLGEPAVKELIDGLGKSHGLTEYYYAERPNGFFFVNASGEIKRLVIQTPEEARQTADTCRALGMPSTACERIARCEMMVDPLVVADANAWPSSENWNDYLVSARPLTGARTTRHWAVFDMQTETGPARVNPSYNEFLEWLDTVGYSMM
ncbi:response regulator [Salinisphaera sp. SPP-AMP-43]|uniref:response regulator n=1 Tax=Salinisphaera sp. SPP-AMP-43 TaxID=3121288 RepID=UPI003C6E8419